MLTIPDAPEWFRNPFQSQNKDMTAKPREQRGVGACQRAPVTSGSITHALRVLLAEFYRDVTCNGSLNSSNHLNTAQQEKNKPVVLWGFSVSFSGLVLWSDKPPGSVTTQGLMCMSAVTLKKAVFLLLLKK